MIFQMLFKKKYWILSVCAPPLRYALPTQITELVALHGKINMKLREIFYGCKIIFPRCDSNH